MHTVRELLSAHAPILWIDSASQGIQAGILRKEAEIWKHSDSEAASGIFDCVNELLKESGLGIKDFGAFVFCEGPGSVLGIRMAAVAIRTWLVIKKVPVFSYKSLELVASALKREDALVIADARRESWHVAKLGVSVKRVDNADLVETDSTLLMPEGFRHWGALPREVKMTSYTVPDMLKKVEDAPLLRDNEAPDAFLHEEPSYVKWNPQIHRAPEGKE